MTPSQSAIFGARVAHVRELKAELAAQKAENAALRERCALLENHLAVAAAAAADLASAKGDFILVDGWNLILGSQRAARSKEELLASARRHLEDNPEDFVWVVLDGKDENASQEGRLRVSYTGGEGSQRADRFILDFIRCAKLTCGLARVRVATHDKKLAAECRRLGAAV